MSFITSFDYFEQLAKHHMCNVIDFYKMQQMPQMFRVGYQSTMVDVDDKVVIAYNNILSSLSEEYQTRFKRFMNVCFYKLDMKPSDYSEYERLLIQSVALQYFICP